jgi:hypothetical protein
VTQRPQPAATTDDHATQPIRFAAARAQRQPPPRRPIRPAAKPPRTDPLHSTSTFTSTRRVRVTLNAKRRFEAKAVVEHA